MNPEKLSKAADTTRLLIQDIQAMLNAKSKGENKENQIASRKSLEPTVRLRKNTEELIKVENTDPESQFILDKLSDIFKR
jgi:hypothetical protein